MKFSSWLILILFASAMAVSGRASGKPNVIYIMADELGYYEPSFMGGRNIQTPNVDRMAREGMRFNNLLAGSSVCAPTRCCFLTGKHSGHTSVRNNGDARSLRPEEATIASLLKTQGYATGGFGKWGCGGRGSPGVPEKHGFDVFFGYYDQQHAHSYYPPYLVRNSQEVPLEGNYGTHGKTYSQYVIHEAALRFIRENKDRPFFAYLPYTPPHGNFEIPDEDPAWQQYKDKGWPEPARRYAAMVTMLDRQIGEVFSLVKEFKIDDNTLVFFSGDNGANDYFKSDEYPRGIHLGNKNPATGVEFRGKKTTLYDGGLRVPFVARWPGKISAGSVSDYVRYFPDLLPTIAEVAGCQPPADIDGISIVPELIGESAAGRKQKQHEFLYWEIADWIAVRQANWRAVKPPGGNRWELYDLSKDPSETANLAAEQPDVLARLVNIAKEAHEPLKEGTYARMDLHERDRRAKFGKQDEPETQPKAKAKKAKSKAPVGAD
ncbi:MAG TPA: arylsulfatase [Pirellulaceae bacterium]|jgi:arylsulfatase A-like enzyme